MNKLFVLTLIILVLVLYIFITYSEKESFDYKSSIDPGFGDQMYKLESANPWDPSMMDELSQNWTDASFGNVVSYLEDRNDATAIKNLPV